MRCRIALAILLLSVILPQATWAATYHVDCQKGNDRSTGLTAEAAWQTVARVNAAELAPGDTVLFRRGGIWREELLIPASGTAQAPITFGAYGEGPLPVLDGADPVTGWQPEARDHVWRARLENEPRLVFFRGRQLRHRPGSGANLADTGFDWRNGDLYVRVGEDPESSDVEASQRNNAILIMGQSHIVIDSIHGRHGNERIVYGMSRDGIKANNITIGNCFLEIPGIDILLVEGGNDWTIHDNVAVGGTKDVFYANTGIMTDGPGLIYRNEVMLAEVGIEFGESAVPYGAIIDNYIHDIDTVDDLATTDVDCQGIELTGAGSDARVQNVQVLRNRVERCSGGGIVLYYANDNHVAANLIVDCGVRKARHDLVEGAFSLWRESTGNTFANNTVVGAYLAVQAQGGTRGNLLVNNILFGGNQGILFEGAGDGNSGDHNCVYGQSGEAFPGGAAPGPGTVLADPLLAAPLSGGYGLLPESPCRDAGRFLGRDYDLALSPVSRWPLMVIPKSQSRHGNGWEIGAFVYVEP